MIKDKFSAPVVDVKSELIRVGETVTGWYVTRDRMINGKRYRFCRYEINGLVWVLAMLYNDTTHDYDMFRLWESHSA